MSDFYLMYADDSGDQEIGSFYSALLVPVPLWNVYLGQWLKFRRWLYTQHQVPARFELHAYQWIAVKGPYPVESDPDAVINTSVGLRRATAFKALQTIGSMRDLAVVTGVPTPGLTTAEAYRALLTAVDTELGRRDAWALAVTDGDPSNPSPELHRAHRDLDLKTRRIVEDGWPQPAHMSQLVQMADLVAHCAFQHRRRADGRSFMWDWYPDQIHALEWSCVCLEAPPVLK